MIIAVTGAKGYAGSQIAAYLESQGDEVVELVRNPDATSLRQQLKFELGTRIDPLEFQSRGIECLVHVAYDFRQIDWDQIRKINYEGSISLFDSFLEGGGKNCCYISTVAAWPGCKSMYGRVKLMTEEAAIKRNFWVIRPGLIRGGSQGGIVGTMLKLVRKFPAVPIIGYGLKCLYPVRTEELSRIVSKFTRISHDDSSESIIVAAHRQAMSLDEVVREMIQEHHLKRRILIPVPWRLAWLTLKSLEKLGISIGLRSDSVISLMNQDPNPPFCDLTEFINCS